jgi:hypothetical protein
MSKKILMVMMLMLVFGLVAMSAWAGNGSVTINGVKVSWSKYEVALQNQSNETRTVSFNTVYEKDNEAYQFNKATSLEIYTLGSAGSPSANKVIQKNGFVEELTNIQVN